MLAVTAHSRPHPEEAAKRPSRRMATLRGSLRPHLRVRISGQGNAMARLPELDPEKFSAEQKKVHEAILKGPRGKVVGPLKVWLKNPGLAEHAQALGASCRFGSSLPPRLSELAICMTGSFWKANYEWFAHAPLAIKAGIEAAAIEAIRT